MCYIPETVAISPLPAYEIPEEELNLDPELEEEQPIVRNRIRTSEDGREYWVPNGFTDEEEVPENMRYYLDSDNEEDQDMKFYLNNYDHFNEDEQMSNHHEDYESEEEELMIDDETNQADDETDQNEEEEGLPAPIPPPSPLPRSSMTIEDRLWERLQESETLTKKRDEEILLLHSKLEYAERRTQHWEYVAKRITASYRESFDKSWRCMNHLRTAERHQQTAEHIEHVAINLERQYDSAQASEQKAFQWVKDH